MTILNESVSHVHSANHVVAANLHYNGSLNVASTYDFAIATATSAETTSDNFSQACLNFDLPTNTGSPDGTGASTYIPVSISLDGGAAALYVIEATAVALTS